MNEYIAISNTISIAINIKVSVFPNPVFGISVWGLLGLFWLFCELFSCPPLAFSWLLFPWLPLFSWLLLSWLLLPWLSSVPGLLPPSGLVSSWITLISIFESCISISFFPWEVAWFLIIIFDSPAFALLFTFNFICKNSSGLIVPAFFINTNSLFSLLYSKFVHIFFVSKLFVSNS